MALRRCPTARPLTPIGALLVLAMLLAGCFWQRPAPAPYAEFQLAPGQVYGPVLVPPISIRLGQSLLRVTGSVGPPDRPEGSAAIWEGHSIALEPDRERNRTVYFYVDADDLLRVTLQLNDQAPIVEERPGAYLSGEFSMVRWWQDYSLRLTAEDRNGLIASAAIHVTGEDARLDGDYTDPPLRMRLLRQGDTAMREVRGIGYRGKLYRHSWPSCGDNCDLTTPGGALIAMVSGPADTLLLLLDGRYPFFATGLSYWPGAHYVIVAIPVREEYIVEIAALSEAGDLVVSRWDRPL